MAGNVGLAERADAQLVSVNGISLDEAHERYGRAHAQWADRSSRARTVPSLPSWSSGTRSSPACSWRPIDSPGIISRRPGPARRRPRSGRLP